MIYQAASPDCFDANDKAFFGLVNVINMINSEKAREMLDAYNEAVEEMLESIIYTDEKLELVAESLSDAGLAKRLLKDPVFMRSGDVKDILEIIGNYEA